MVDDDLGQFADLDYRVRHGIGLVQEGVWALREDPPELLLLKYY